jgi:hypothetical protein
MAIAKKPCINDATFTYTGKEMSPLGLGYCASAEKVGHFMKGKDNTMWMVGMKNGVKVWNRVPSEVANAPLQKEEPVLQETTMDEAGPSEAPPAPKKKAAPRKKASNVEKEEPDNVKEEAAEPQTVEPAVAVATAVEEAVVEAAVEEKPTKKKAAPRKKSPTPKPEQDEDTASEGKKEKKTRKPTDFNLFMKYRMMHMSKDIKHKDKFQMAAKEWKQLDADAKKEIMEKVHAEFST